MSQRLRIMAEAEEASLFLRSYDRKEGERRFSDMVSRYPDDGMVYFKRGQAYEAIGRPEKAIDDYRSAEAMFPVREWKLLATEGIGRCTTDIRLTKLPREVMAIWRETVHMPTSPPRARPMMGRAAVERTADCLIRQFRLTTRGPDLKDKLETLRASRKVDSKVMEDLNTIKGFGDAAAHGGEIDDEQATICHEAGLRVVEFLIGRKDRLG